MLHSSHILAWRTCGTRGKVKNWMEINLTISRPHSNDSVKDWGTVSRRREPSSDQHQTDTNICGSHSLSLQLDSAHFTISLRKSYFGSSVHRWRTVHDTRTTTHSSIKYIRIYMMYSSSSSSYFYQRFSCDLCAKRYYKWQTKWKSLLHFY